MTVVGTLYKLDLSPPCRAVLITAKKLGIALDAVDLDLFGGANMTPEYLKMNPQHTVPTYKDKDGTAMGDSHAIMVYLVDKYGKEDALYPKDVSIRALVNQRLHFDSGNIYALHLDIVVPMWRKENEKNVVTKKQRDRGETAYDILNRFLEGNQWVAGTKRETIADLSLATSVASFCVVVPFDPKKFPNILPWLKRCEALPYYKAVKGQEEYKVVLECMLNNDYSFMENK